MFGTIGLFGIGTMAEISFQSTVTTEGDNEVIIMYSFTYWTVSERMVQNIVRLVKKCNCAEPWQLVCYSGLQRVSNV